MIHLGDICQIQGDQIPAVDVITGGSPCQDLSVAGKRAGLAGERSGLFMEQMRIVREMRERDRRDGRTGWAIRPRYMVWENVPGAFSSGTPKGADFAAVIEEIIKVAEQGASVCVCVPEGGWTKSGCYYADDGTWSVAWRVHDAQFWGVPQRRKRIALVADFGGMSAPEILFVRKGLHGDFEPGGAAGQGTPAGAEGGAGGAISFQERAGKPGGGKGLLLQNERTGGLSAQKLQNVLHSGQHDRPRREAEWGGISTDTAHTLNGTDRHGVFAVDCRNGTENPTINGTLQAKSTGGQGVNFQNVVRTPYNHLASISDKAKMPVGSGTEGNKPLPFAAAEEETISHVR